MGGGVVAEMVASSDKEQPPAVLQREREGVGKCMH